MKFETNIMCGACIAKVTPVLNGIAGEEQWNVDTANPQKMLTIRNESVAKEEIIEALEKIGYKASVAVE